MLGPERWRAGPIERSTYGPRPALYPLSYGRARPLWCSVTVGVNCGERRRWALGLLVAGGGRDASPTITMLAILCKAQLFRGRLLRAGQLQSPQGRSRTGGVVAPSREESSMVRKRLHAYQLLVTLPSSPSWRRSSSGVREGTREGAPDGLPVERDSWAQPSDTPRTGTRSTRQPISTTTGSTGPMAGRTSPRSRCRTYGTSRCGSARPTPSRRRCPRSPRT